MSRCVLLDDYPGHTVRCPVCNYHCSSFVYLALQFFYMMADGSCNFLSQIEGGDITNHLSVADKRRILHEQANQD